MAHPVRPNYYNAVDNLYSTTVYGCFRSMSRARGVSECLVLLLLAVVVTRKVPRLSACCTPSLGRRASETVIHTLPDCDPPQLL